MNKVSEQTSVHRSEAKEAVVRSTSSVLSLKCMAELYTWTRKSV